jgi:hypothetical protein
VVYGVTRLSDYRDVDKAWRKAADRRNDLLRASREPDDPGAPVVAQAREPLREAGHLVQHLAQARTDMRARCRWRSV